MDGIDGEDLIVPSMESAISPEQRFLQYAQSRNTMVLDDLLREHVDLAYTHARRLAGADLAEDAVQEACVRLVVTAERYRGDIPFAAWFYRLVHTASIDQRRRQQSKQRVIAKAAMSGDAAKESSQEDARLEQVRAAMQKLPEPFRETLSLYYFAGLDREGVARALGLPPGTVASRINRGLERLRSSLGKLGFACSVAALANLLGEMPAHAAPAQLSAKLSSAAAVAASKGSVAAAGGSVVFKWSVAAAIILSASVPLYLSALGKSSDNKLAALVAKQASGTWLEVPDSSIRAVFPQQAQYPDITAVMGPDAVIEAWGGAALDTKRDRLVLWGGGHTNYSGNELYAFDIRAQCWMRLTDPFPQPVQNQETNADGTPNSRATYGGLAYLAHADRFFAHGGALAGGGWSSTETWTFDFERKRWDNRKSAANPGGGYCRSCAYDPQSRLVWWGSERGLWSYDYERNEWTQHGEARHYQQSCALDTKRHRLVFAGRGEVFAYDLDKSDFVPARWPTADAEPFLAPESPGFDYDPIGDRLVGWNGGPIYELDPQSHAWTAHPVSGGPRSVKGSLHGRWRYVPSIKAFIAVADSGENVFVYKP